MVYGSRSTSQDKKLKAMSSIDIFSNAGQTDSMTILLLYIVWLDLYSEGFNIMVSNSVFKEQQK